MAVEVQSAASDLPEVVPQAVEASAKPASKAKQVKFKEPASKKATAAHPPYLQMVKEAISSLHERSGSSQHAIAKFLEDKYKTGLPSTFKRMLAIQLKNMSNSGKLIKVKNSFKLAPKKSRSSKPESPSKTAAEPKAKIVKKPSERKPAAVAAAKTSKKRAAPGAAAAAAKPKKKAATASSKKAAAASAKSAAAAATIKGAAERDSRAASRAASKRSAAPSPAKPKKATTTAKRAKRVAAL